ncbi:MAG TPA: hypothetical protein VE553_09000 [Candidatus Binatia bacterium]|jgi:hypothetical protein|nr:hypothetical protein [Candidatus Binatia bacterium]
MTQMNYNARLTLLSMHADRLNEGEEPAERFLQRQVHLGPDMLALLSLARRLKQALTPVPVPDPFRAQLRDDLVARWGETEARQEGRSRRPLWYSLAAVGSVLPLLGIFVWRRRRRSHTLMGTG